MKKQVEPINFTRLLKQSMAKIIHYRNKCIGCAICYEMQPHLWRMSNKDGKAILLQAESKRKVFVLPLDSNEIKPALIVAKACPVKIIKIV